MSSPKNQHEKKGQSIRLGKKEAGEYRYHSKVDFNEDLGTQIDKLMQEKKAKDDLDLHVKEIEQAITGFGSKAKSINYYWEIGKLLTFLDSVDFRNIKPYSLARMLAEELPDIVPGIEKKRVTDHIMMMFRIGHLPFQIIERANWEQWYEITKFKGLTRNISKLDHVLLMAGKSTGPDLREKIQSLVEDE